MGPIAKGAEFGEFCPSLGVSFIDKLLQRALGEVLKYQVYLKASLEHGPTNLHSWPIGF